MTAIGGKYAVKDNREIPDTLEVFHGSALLTFSQYNANSAPGNALNSEMELRGTKGTAYLFGNKWEIIPEKVTDAEVSARTPLDRITGKAYGPSKKAAMEPKRMSGSADTAFHAATQIGNIAYKTKSHLEWEAAAERFTNNAAANKLLLYQYRAPYKLG